MVKLTHKQGIALLAKAAAFLAERPQAQKIALLDRLAAGSAAIVPLNSADEACEDVTAQLKQLVNSFEGLDLSETQSIAAVLVGRLGEAIKRARQTGAPKDGQR